MANKNNSSNLNESSSLSAVHKNEFSNSNKYKNVEPLPESSRPRRDGPGGEDGE